MPLDDSVGAQVVITEGKVVTKYCVILVSDTEGVSYPLPAICDISADSSNPDMSMSKEYAEKEAADYAQLNPAGVYVVGTVTYEIPPAN